MNSNENPFRVKQPFEMATDEFRTYWVRHHYYENLLRPEHCFIYGPPGTGKSMLTRHLMPDIQLNGIVSAESFYGVHIPLRGRSFTQGAWDYLTNHRLAAPLSEHILCSYVVICLLEQLLDERYSRETALSGDVIQWRRALSAVRAAFRPGLRKQFEVPEHVGRVGLIDSWLQATKDLFGAGHETAIRCLTDTSQVGARHALMSFDDLTGLLRSLIDVGVVKASKFYLLFDDVDDLRRDQALALNHWIARRLHSIAVIKCNSESRYITYQTMANRRIRDPHDFYQIWLTSVYTRESVNNYEKFLEEVTDRRLSLSGFETKARDYFPGDEAQAKAIDKVAKAIARKHKDPERVYAGPDAAYRLAESEYLKQLRKRRQLPTYRYCGFSVLADISSNTVRHFLTSASDMFSETAAATVGQRIPVQIQNQVVRRHAEELVFNELRDLAQHESDPQRRREMEGLERLVLGIGMRCKVRLFSDASERRVFSFAFQDTPSIRLQAVLDTGVQHGFFQVGSISDKEGLARRRLYVLTRRVAPFFSLLVNSYSGYLSLKAIELEKMLDLPVERLRIYSRDEAALATYQTELDFEEDEAISL